MLRPVGVGFYRLAVVVLLSNGSLSDVASKLSICTADHPKPQRVILLHLTESCPFPSYSDMPRDAFGSVSSGFNSKAIPYVNLYQKECFATVCTDPQSPSVKLGHLCGRVEFDRGGSEKCLGLGNRIIGFELCMCHM